MYDGREFVIIATLPEKRAKHKMTYLGAKLYIIGGLTSNSSNEFRLADVNYSYTLSSQKWETIANLKESRVDFGCTVISNLIYVCCGLTTDNELTGSIEFYNPVNDVWTLITKLNLPRKKLGLSSLNDSIYIVGGIGPNQIPLKNVTFHNTVTHKWFKAKSLDDSFINILLVNCLDNLYLIGTRKAELLLTILMYNKEDDVWKEKLNLNKNLTNYFGFSFEQKIFICGGYDSDSKCLSNELIVYDVTLNECLICSEFSKKISFNQAYCLI